MKLGKWHRQAVIFAIFAATVLAWKAVIVVFRIPTFVLPSPELVWAALVGNFRDGFFFKHLYVSTMEIVWGFVIGTVLGLLLGYALALAPLVEDVVYPYIIGTQAIPKIAIAPLLVLWFGFGPMAKVVGAIILVFFPVLVNTLVGVASVDRSARDLFTSLNATRMQVFTMLEVPASLPLIIASLKIGVTLAVIGAVTVEFVGANAGLGFVVVEASYNGRSAVMFAALAVLTALALALYFAVLALERTLLRWHASIADRRTPEGL